MPWLWISGFAVRFGMFRSNWLLLLFKLLIDFVKVVLHSMWDKERRLALGWNAVLSDFGCLWRRSHRGWHLLCRDHGVWIILCCCWGLVFDVTASVHWFLEWLDLQPEIGYVSSFIVPAEGVSFLNQRGSPLVKHAHKLFRRFRSYIRIP